MAEPEPEIEGNISNNMPKSAKRLGNTLSASYIYKN